MPNDDEGSILIEGFLGKLENVNFIESVMLDINGANGSLRMDLSEQELKGLLQKRPPLRKKTYKGDEYVKEKKRLDAKIAAANNRISRFMIGH